MNRMKKKSLKSLEKSNISEKKDNQTKSSILTGLDTAHSGNQKEER